MRVIYVDAYHLACALYLDPEGKDLLFASADQKQAEAAHKMKFRTIEI
jgi:hypothetical protein